MSYLTGEVVWSDLITPDTKYEAKYRIRIKLSGEDLERATSEQMNLSEDSVFTADMFAFTQDGERRDPPAIMDLHGKTSDVKAPSRGDTVEVDYTPSSKTTLEGKHYAFLNSVRVIERSERTEAA